MRIFLALLLSEEVRQTLAQLLAELRGVDTQPRWVNPANLHITLKFIGHVPDDKLASLIEVLATVATPRPFTLEFCQLGFFPNDRRPAVFWAGVEARPELAALAATIDKSLLPCGIAGETRPFAPHLTLARFKETRLSPGLRAQVEKLSNRSFGKQRFQEFHLMESKLRSTGSEYTTLRSFPFTAEGKNQ